MINRKKCIDKMADRIPLIVNATVNQLQELPNQDDLVLSGQLKMTGTTAGASDINLSGGNDAISVITVTETSSNLSQLSIDCRNNADNSDLQVAEFKVGASNKIEFVSKGEVTAVQPTCLLTVPKQYNANNSDHGSTPHVGGTNRKPISFSREFTNVNCTTSLASDATVNSGITSITVPSAGTYLVSAMIGGVKSGSSDGNDQIRFALSKTGISTFPMSTTDGGGALAGDTYPTFVFGDDNGEEFNANFTLPLPLNANDTLSVHLSHIGGSAADIHEGYFSVAKLH